MAFRRMFFIRYFVAKRRTAEVLKKRPAKKGNAVNGNQAAIHELRRKTWWNVLAVVDSLQHRDQLVALVVHLHSLTSVWKLSRVLDDGVGTLSMDSKTTDCRASTPRWVRKPVWSSAMRTRFPSSNHGSPCFSMSGRQTRVMWDAWTLAEVDVEVRAVLDTGCASPLLSLPATAMGHSLAQHDCSNHFHLLIFHSGNSYKWSNQNDPNYEGESCSRISTTKSSNSTVLGLSNFPRNSFEDINSTDLFAYCGNFVKQYDRDSTSPRSSSQRICEEFLSLLGHSTRVLLSLSFPTLTYL